MIPDDYSPPEFVIRIDLEHLVGPAHKHRRMDSKRYARCGCDRRLIMPRRRYLGSGGGGGFFVSNSGPLRYRGCGVCGVKPTK